MYHSFGVYLKEQGAIDDRALKRAQQAFETSQSTSYSGSFARILTDLGLISKGDLFEAFEAYFSLPVVSKLPEKATVLDGVLNPGFLNYYRLLPVSTTNEEVTLFTADPTDVWAIEAVEYAMDKKAKLQLVKEGLLVQGLRDWLGSRDDNEVEASEGFADDLSRLQELASDAPVIRYLDQLIDEAVGRGASDIHIEPIEDGVSVRLRRDGVLEPVPGPDPRYGAALLSRIKILAGLDIAEKRLPQDGRLKQMVHGREFDFRVASSPTLHGETIVLRLLDRMTVPEGLASLGFSEEDADNLYRASESSEGIVLVTGPTGSGKTTSLYSLLNHLNKDAVKILTVEDPVEYRLSGINQTQVDHRIGLTFASTLRSFLRQDPDIIMVGEIRDEETAEIAFRAAETGHLVLSTLHTNDAASAITRLKDMGLAGFLMAGPLRAIAAQRLVRLLCSACKQEEALTEKERTLFGLQAAFKPRGCEACNHSGFRGRQVIAEVLPVTDTLRGLIKSEIDAKTIAKKAGGQRLLDHGRALVKDGRTSPQEVLRVVSE